MSAVKVRNIEIGRGMPKICVPIVEESMEEILVYAEKIRNTGADIVEWRADFFSEIDSIDKVLEVLERLRSILEDIPIIFTLRSREEGGKSSLNTEKYFKTIKCVSEKRLPDIVDIEMNQIEKADVKAVERIKNTGVKVIISFHDFEKTERSDELLKKADQMKNMGADIVKIAVMSRNTEDMISLLTCSWKYGNSTPLIAISMGSCGMLSRVAGEVFGSSVTFCSLEKSSAPGQIDIHDTESILEIIHRNMDETDRN